MVLVVERGMRAVNPAVSGTGLVTFIPLDGRFPNLTVPMSAPPDLSPANPTFDTVSRPFGVGVNRWNGYGVETQTLMVMFAGAWNAEANEQADIGGEVGKLHTLAIPPGYVEPPILRLEGKGVYGNGAQDRWQIQAISPQDGTLVSRESDGFTSQVEYQITLARWYPSEVVTFTSPAAKAVAGKPGGITPAGQRTYTVAKGDVLSRIAQRELGNANRWKEIADLNGLRDPNKIKPGQILKLP